MPRAMLELVGVSKSFGAQAVLRGVSLTVAEGHTCVLLGRSGAGKTVLLKLLLGLLEPDAGQVRVDGDDLATLDEAGREALHRKMGVLFQNGALFDSLTVYENLAFPLRERTKKRPAEIREAITRALALVGLSGTEDEFPAALSGGMQKRVAFARAVVLEPKILLYDDPTAGLDPLTTALITDEMVDARHQLGVGITTLAITEDLPSAFRVADQVVLLHEGVIVEDAPPEVFQRSKHPAVRAFLHDWLARRAAGEQA
jgi:phospholipid/cholesterol/gamma-HCH transport system ATP-binding protein